MDAASTHGTSIIWDGYGMMIYFVVFLLRWNELLELLLEDIQFGYSP